MHDHLSLVTSHFSPRNVIPSSAIFPWIVGDEQAALDLARALRGEGFLVPAIRYPTVAKGAARLRVTVTASHDENQIRSLCEAIKRNSL
jgi:8-amino-7-oxononanoate synthase